MPNKLKATDVLKDPATSVWLREALSGALLRDPVDAVNDGEVLLEVLTERADKAFATALAGTMENIIAQTTNPGGDKI